MTITDIIIILIILFFAYQGYRHGFWIIISEFLTFLISVLISLRLYPFAADILQTKFSVGTIIANPFAFLLTAVLSEIILGFIFGYLIDKIPKKFANNKLNKYLGIIPGIGEGIVILVFFLTFALSLPISASVKENISNSRIGSSLVLKIFDQSLTTLVIKPGSHETIALPVGKLNLAVDANSETSMFDLVNNERKTRGIKELVWDPNIVAIARDYARDMWTRHYFSHYSPEGKDVGNRLLNAHIIFTLAGENLALAPTLSIAHTGLMNSQAHKENILEPGFRKVGIGVIDNGFYGKIFVQVFTD